AAAEVPGAGRVLHDQRLLAAPQPRPPAGGPVPPDIELVAHGPRLVGRHRHALGPGIRHPPVGRLAAAAELEDGRSEEHTSELQSRSDLVCRLLLEKKKKHITSFTIFKKKKKYRPTK